MGCAMLLDLGVTEDGVRVAELGAFCVDPSFRQVWGGSVGRRVSAKLEEHCVVAALIP